MNLTNFRNAGRLAFIVILVVCLASLTLFAKGPTVKITIESPSLTKPIQITDPAIIKDFQVFAGPGTSSNEPQSLIIDWAGGPIAAPSGSRRIESRFTCANTLNRMLWSMRRIPPANRVMFISLASRMKDIEQTYR